MTPNKSLTPDTPPNPGQITAPASAVTPAAPTPATARRRRVVAGGLQLAGLMALALVGLMAAHQVPARSLIELGKPEAIAFIHNFYELESGGNRWSQTQSHVFIQPLDAAPTIRVTLDNPGAPEATGRPLTLELVGQPVSRTFRLQPGNQTYELVGSGRAGLMPPPFVAYNGEGFIEAVWVGGPVLRLSTTAYQPRGDRRQLGVVLRSVETRAGWTTGRIGLPTPATVALTIAVTLGGLGLWRRRRLAGSLIVTGVWTAVVALGRGALADKLPVLVLLAGLGLAVGRFAGPLALADLRRRWRAGSHPLRPGYAPSAAPVEAGSGYAPEEAGAGEDQKTGRGLWRLVTVVGLAAFGLHLGGLILPDPASDFDTRAFGLRYTARLPWPLTVLMGLAVAGAACGPVNRRVVGLLAGAGRQWRTIRPGKLSRAGLSLAALGLVAAGGWLLRTRLDYGDYEQIVYKLERLRQIDNTPGGLKNVLLWREGEILDYALHFLGWRVLKNLDWWEPGYTYSVTSALAGGVFAIVTGRIAAALGRAGAARLLIAGLTLTCGTTLVFMGYVESYTLVTLAALVYAWAALGAFAAPRGVEPLSIIWPGAALGLAILLHPQAVFLGPSYGVGLLWRAGLNRPCFDWRRLWREAGQSAAIGALMLTSLIVFMIFYGYGWPQWDVAQYYVGGSDRSLFKPLWQARPGTAELYPIWSGSYLRFQFNLQMLVAPVGLALLGGLAARQVWRWRAGGEGQAGAGAGAGLILAGVGLFGLALTIEPGRYLLWLAVAGLGVQLAGLGLVRRRITDPAGLWLGTAALYTWLFSLVWNPDLGSKDWDLLSLNGVFTSLAAGYWLSRAASPGWLPRLTLAALTASGAIWLGWIGYNAFFYR